MHIVKTLFACIQDSAKLAAAGGTKPDKKRPKSAKRKKPNEMPGPGSAGGVATTQLTRVDGTKSAGPDTNASIKLETGSSGGTADDSGINIPDAWQRNGHSADFIRQGAIV